MRIYIPARCILKKKYQDMMYKAQNCVQLLPFIIFSLSSPPLPPILLDDTLLSQIYGNALHNNFFAKQKRNGKLNILRVGNIRNSKKNKGENPVVVADDNDDDHVQQETQLGKK